MNLFIQIFSLKNLTKKELFEMSKLKSMMSNQKLKMKEKNKLRKIHSKVRVFKVLES